MREPLSEIAYRALQVVQARTQKQGQDLFQELNRVGLLATEPRIQEIEKSTLTNAMTELELIGPSELMAAYNRGNSNPGTPMDMYNAIIRWFHERIR